MTLEQAEAIVELLESETDATAEVQIGYSGRGMFGKTCVGIVTDDPTAVGWAAGRIGMGYDEIPSRRDSMGMDTIVY